MVWPTVVSGRTAMYSVPIRRPAESSGYSRLRARATRLGCGSRSKMSFCRSLGRPSRIATETGGAGAVMGFGKRVESKPGAEELDQPRAQVRIERRQQVAEIRLVPTADEIGQRGPVVSFDRGGDLLDDVGANRPAFIAQVRLCGRDRGNGAVVDHAAPFGMRIATSLRVMRRSDGFVRANRPCRR